MVHRTREILFVILVLLSVVAAWLVGAFRQNASVGQVLMTVMPDALHFEQAPDDVYIGLVRMGNVVRPVGYVGLCSATGNLGPIKIAAGFNEQGSITRIALVDPLASSDVSMESVNTMLNGFVGRHYSERPTTEYYADLAPTAQMLWNHLTQLVTRMGQNVSRVQGKVSADGYQRRRWFGFPELILILLYTVGYLAYREKTPYHRHLHWGVLVAALIFLGFCLKRPMSLEYINSFLMGYWPSWQTHLYWYLLIGGVLMPIILTGRSFYCSHVCPFGAAQKLLKSMGPAKVAVPEKVDAALRWGQRALVWVAVICALIVRNPAVVRYEVSHTLFGLTGVTWQFVLLAAVLVASLLITRPWCNYLCPIRAVTDFINLVRRAVGLPGPTVPSSGCAC